MAEKPILFSGPMVPPVLDGRKTQTRRVIKPQPPSRSAIEAHTGCVDMGLYETKGRYMVDGPVGVVRDIMGAEYPKHHYWTCPYGQPGDGLWVKETHRLWCPEMEWHVRYKADNCERRCDCDWDEGPQYQSPQDAGLDTEPSKWRPSIYMPRWASRIDLELLDVRVERVQDISGADIIAEGLSTTLREHDACCHLRDQWIMLWDSINSAPKPVKVGGRLDHYVSYPWDDIHETRTHRDLPWLVQGNPWVWALTFKRKGA